MQSRSRYPKKSKSRLLAHKLVWLCPVAVKESPGITSIRLRTVGRASYSDSELLPRNWIKTEINMTVGEWRSSYRSQSLCVIIPLNEQGESIFIGTELYLLLTAPTQIKRTFRLDAINVQQLRMSTDPLLPGQETLQVKTVKDYGRVRKSSGNTPSLQVLGKDSEVQVLGIIPSTRGLLRDHSESKYSEWFRGQVRELFQVQVLGSLCPEARS